MDAPQINPATKKEIRQYADLVIYRFQMLNKKYDSNYREGALDSDTSDFDPDTSDSDPDTSESDGFNPTQDELPQDEADPAAEVPSNLENHSEGLYDPEDYPPQGQLTKTGAWDQLNSTLLPLLTDLITNMHVCLDPARLLKDPAVNLSLVLELQPRLDHTLHQIKHAINILCPKRESDSWRRELHPQKFKSSRLLPLKVALKENLWGLTSSLIREFCRDIKALGLSYPYFRSRYDSGDWRWKPAT
ncbi:hypothetical protein PCANC_12887 [Puccinia coronata f. sp. avenae]|uniref:Uncharacterized protein n=1 Tax=Puccinia coronata f. sp. avenae TaxID=200324 RepID=A0A2N5VE54_9BASI|nr:hypothetical protein PCANC_12887 [Puccinia coronata f. sp. avenae]